jgi:glycine/D-amino acid oxidase-like deaminating enzyme
LSEDFCDEPWWWRAAAPTQETGDELPEKTDVAIVGSGYTGLSCALELARSGTDVTVIDAEKLGFGASTRNAGFVTGRAGVSKQINLVAAVGSDRAETILEEADEAYEHLQEVISTEKIPCAFEPVGRFVGAHTAAAYGKLEDKMGEYNSDGRNLFHMVGQRQQRDYVGNYFWSGGMFTQNAGTIHPSLYHKGLLDLCRQSGVRFISQNRVLAIADDGREKRIDTVRGPLAARQVVLGTNGYTDALSPWHQRRLVPISSTIVATEELGEDRVRAILPKLCPVIDTKRVICFARPTPDHKRVLFGGRARFSPVGPAESAEILHKQLSQIFPDLHDVKVTNAWSGYMAFTFDFLPKIGMHDGVHYAIGCNGGCGIVMMSWLGHQVARKILGSANRPSAFEKLPFKSQPFYSGKPWFLPLVGNWWRFRDWLDIQQAKPSQW